MVVPTNIFFGLDSSRVEGANASVVNSGSEDADEAASLRVSSSAALALAFRRSRSPRWTLWPLSFPFRRRYARTEFLPHAKGRRLRRAKSERTARGNRRCVEASRRRPRRRARETDVPGGDELSSPRVRPRDGHRLAVRGDVERSNRRRSRVQHGDAPPRPSIRVRSADRRRASSLR